MFLLWLCKHILHFLSAVAKGVQLDPPPSEKCTLSNLSLSAMALVKACTYLHLFISSLNFDWIFIKVSASSYWQTNKMHWIWKKPHQLQFNSGSFCCSDFTISSCPYPGFQGDMQGSECFFQTFQGRWCPCIRLHLDTAPSGRPTACAADRQAWNAERTCLFHAAFPGSKIYWG